MIKVSGRGPALGLPPSFGAVGLPLLAQLQADDSTSARITAHH